VTKGSGTKKDNIESLRQRPHIGVEGHDHYRLSLHPCLFEVCGKTLGVEGHGLSGSELFLHACHLGGKPINRLVHVL
jgi:hypothetical protein